MQLPLQIDHGAGQILQLQIFEQIRRMILDRRLLPGVRMPSSRILAADLGIARNTVVLAYDRLAAEGYIQMRQPVGAFVANDVIFDGPALPATVPAKDEPGHSRRDARVVFRGAAHRVARPRDQSIEFDFWVGRPDTRLFPKRLWEQMLNHQLNRTGFSICSYGEPAGLRELRDAIAAHVGVARGIKATADEVLITSGIQQGLNILARMFIRHGTPIAVEDPCYCGAANTFLSYGARLVPVETDAAGAKVDGLSCDPPFLYLTPSHQYPTGVTMPIERRERVLDWATRAGAYVVEDDYDSDFYYDRAPLPALHSLDEHEQVIYLGTFSKSLAAGLRIGYMILPRPLVASAVAVKALLDNCTAWLPQALLAEFLTTGAFDHHLRRIRTIYRARRDCLAGVLREHFGAVDLRGTQSGMHAAWRLPDCLPTAEDFAQLCRRHGVAIYGIRSGNSFVSRRDPAHYERIVMLGYAALNEREIAEGIARVAMAAAGHGSGASPGLAHRPQSAASRHPTLAG
ncbi:MAG: PLP-dependent aminotransferase family protein [Proteobacteria bacterium]|nr:PLP-dependent aminotransferase family protein [Pseudomonadota bacterium]